MLVPMTLTMLRWMTRHRSDAPARKMETRYHYLGEEDAREEGNLADMPAPYL